MYWNIATDFENKMMDFNGFALETWQCNTGGPMSRTRREQIHSTLLGDLQKSLCWPSVLRAGLIFPERVSPVSFLSKLLKQEGFASPEQLRSCFPVPCTLMTCRPTDVTPGSFVDVAKAAPDQILEQALLLGLCGVSFYDPARPVIWTNGALQRKVELFAMGEFYD